MSTAASLIPLESLTCIPNLRNTHNNTDVVTFHSKMKGEFFTICFWSSACTRLSEALPALLTTVVFHLSLSPPLSLPPSGSVEVGSSASVTFEVNSAEYLPDLGMQRLVNFTVMCWVPSPEQSFIHVESKRLHIPDVDIQINGQGEPQCSH